MASEAVNWKFWPVGTAAFAGLIVTRMPESRVTTQVPVILVSACEVAVMVTDGVEVTVVAVGGGVVTLLGAVKVTVVG